jgi:hypothetical protein
MSAFQFVLAALAFTPATCLIAPVVLPTAPCTSAPARAAVVMQTPERWQRDPDQWKRTAEAEEPSPAEAYGNIEVEGAAGEILDVLDEDERRAAIVKADAAKAAASVGELGAAVGMAALASAWEITKMTGSAVGGAIVEKAGSQPRTDKPAAPSAAPAPVATRPPPQVERPPPADVSFKTTVGLLREAAELEIEAAKLRVEARTIEIATNGIDEVKNLPNKLKQYGIDRVETATRHLDMDVQAKLRKKRLLERQITSGNDKLAKRVDRITSDAKKLMGVKPPPPEPPKPPPKKWMGLF